MITRRHRTFRSARSCGRKGTIYTTHDGREFDILSVTPTRHWLMTPDHQLTLHGTRRDAVAAMEASL